GFRFFALFRFDPPRHSSVMPYTRPSSPPPGPRLITRTRDDASNVRFTEEDRGATPHHHECDEDDSMPSLVLGSQTGDRRAHTPQRLNGTNTPSRPRTPSSVNRAVTPTLSTPVAAPATDTGSMRKPKLLSRRKQRRWDNDNFFGVDKLILSSGGRIHGKKQADDEDGESDYLTVSVRWRSSLGDLVSDTNAGSAANTALREELRKGHNPVGM
ncbi:unnamed protein product, partial [Discosporangium mesarthrocarpum]